MYSLVRRIPKWLVAGLVIVGLGLLIRGLPLAHADSEDLPLITNFTTVTDSGCAGCSVSWNSSNNTLTASIAGGADSLDTAYGLADFGGSSGWSGRTYARTILGFPTGQAAINANLSVFQELDVNQNLIYELYINGSNHQLCVYSPTGGLGGYILNCTGVVVPTGSTIRVEVSALANNSIDIRINDSDVLNLANLSGATTGNPRYIVAGIHHYDASSTNEPVQVVHQDVGVTTLGWLGTRTTQ